MKLLKPAIAVLAAALASVAISLSPQSTSQTLASSGLTPEAYLAAGGGTHLAGCFGYRGVELGNANAYECIFQGDSQTGALYWQRNNNDYDWDLHPASGRLPVNAITFPLGQQNPYYGFTAVVDSSEGGCQVIGPGYDQHPTQCRNPGQSPKTMDPRFQASVNDFERVMDEALGPVHKDCAWEPAGTPASQTC